MNFETENFIRKQVRQFLLTEAEDLAATTGQEKEIERARTRGRPPKWISETEGLAASNPTELLKRLGVLGLKPDGRNLLEKAGKFVKAAIKATPPMKTAFRDPVTTQASSGAKGVKIFLNENIPYPHRYIRWTLDAARRNGQISLPENFQIDDMGSYVVIYEAEKRHTWKG
jgi:hypothetical protein